MATDQLILGPLAFDDWSTPSRLPFGGKQAMAVHKLPGGARVVDTLGPDEMDIRFSAILWGDAAYDAALALNGLRQSGLAVPLMFGGQFYLVIVEEATVTLERYPQYALYEVTCLIAANPMAGGLGAVVSTVTSIVGADMASAMSLAGL